MSVFKQEAFEDLFEGLRNGQEHLAHVQLEVEAGENKLSPLDMLRFFQGERTLEESDKLARALFAGKELCFKTAEGVDLLQFKLQATKAADEYFESAPWLLEVFYTTAWNILLKKLTPPSTAWAVSDVS